MKKIAIIVLLFVSILGYSQQKKYVSYTVQQGETMKDIAKEYKISTRDLLRLNPDVSRKPKANTVIIVPNLNFGNTVESVNSNVVEKGIYLVKPKETWFGIAKKFNISVEELKVANLTISDLKIGTKLIIPEAKESVEQIVEDDVLKYKLHKVIKDDTVYNLTKRYNVSEQELLQLNPVLKDGLKLGMVLKIKPISNTLTEVDSTEILEETKKIFVENFASGKSLNVVLMLPYQLNKIDDSSLTNKFEKNQLLNIATDIHMGVLMAIDSLKHKGLSINLKYFDTENSIQKLQNIITNNNLDDADVVIGPLFYDKAVWLSKKVDAPVVAPMFSKKQDQLASNNIVKSMPSNKLLDKALFNYLEKNYKGENIIVINDGKADTQKALWQTVNKMKAFDSIQTISVLKPGVRKDKKENLVINNEKLVEKLSLTSNNWIILITDENETTASAINGLKSYNSEDFKLRLFSFEKGDNFDKVDNNLLGMLNFTYPTSEFIDMSAPTVQRFYKKYQSLNYAVPTKYSVRGFDVAYDVLARLASNNSFEDGMKAGVSRRLSHTFNFNKKLFGPTENTEVYLIQYNKELAPIILE
ncbi:LysM peptidoglycan-binding domain-containing protein [Lutibacter sp. TH_r2]|uniref:LysM peptidoglycan-binding domain-containing protein n=1 Tax=Lutibacter sp. TH_r2 TaxID=3082083 RepID=UPI002953F976|nr:LysM peptidoglycan-binding domain-containing protein [Lutibacter sp. TH_r2]MDV7186010.1 LysM peptidoglycan-binding domain-containing protein [Lutibacter sp. TH_r2]